MYSIEALLGGGSLTQALFEARGRVDDYIQESMEARRFILWKNTRVREMKVHIGMGNETIKNPK